MASFLASSWRRLLFPYLEGTDDEDPTTNTHWMSNLTNQALGLDRDRSRDLTPTTSSSGTSWSGETPPTSPSSLASDSKDVPWASMYLRQSSFDQSNDDGSSSTSVASSDSQDTSLVSHLRRYERPGHFAAQSSGSRPGSRSRSRPRSHANIVDRINPAVAATPTQKLQRQEPRTASQQLAALPPALPLPPPALPINFRSAANAPLRSRHDAHNTSTSSLESVASTSSKTSRKSRTHGHRRQRSATHPQPLTPAQPLDHVNTFLPVRVPPLELQAKSPLEYPAGFFADGDGDGDKLALKESLRSTSRRTRRGNNPRSTPSALASDGDVPSSTATVIHCSESDGSHHGDPGDDDPESQLAAGIARLKAKERERQQQQQQHGKARSNAGQSSSRTVSQETTRRGSVTDAVVATAAPAAVDDDDEQTSKEIAEHAGIFNSLADIVLEFKIMRSGPFRLRATSHAAVTDLAPQGGAAHAGAGPIARSHSVDTIGESPNMRTTRAFHHGHGPAHAKSPMLLSSTGISTPDSLRDEVKQWSRERRKSRATPKRVISPPPQVEDFPFATSLIGRSSSFRDFASIAEALPVDDEEDDEHGHASGMTSPQHIALLSSRADSRTRLRHAHTAFAEASSSASASADSDDDIDTDAEYDGAASTTTATEDAFSSLWATPAASSSSRSSSQYNLELLSSDERSAFDEEVQASFLRASLRGGKKSAARARQPGRGMAKM